MIIPKRSAVLFPKPFTPLFMCKDTWLWQAVRTKTTISTQLDYLYTSERNKYLATIRLKHSNISVQKGG